MGQQRERFKSDDRSCAEELTAATLGDHLLCSGRVAVIHAIDCISLGRRRNPDVGHTVHFEHPLQILFREIKEGFDLSDPGICHHGIEWTKLRD